MAAEFRAVSTTAQENIREVVRHLGELARAVNLLGEGKSGNVLTVTLTANSATTTVVTQAGVRIGPNSAFHFDPMTANARTELGSGQPYATTSDRLIGQVTFNHTNNAQTDRTFRVTVIG